MTPANAVLLLGLLVLRLLLLLLLLVCRGSARVGGLGLSRIGRRNGPCGRLRRRGMGLVRRRRGIRRGWRRPIRVGRLGACRLVAILRGSRVRPAMHCRRGLVLAILLARSFG